MTGVEARGQRGAGSLYCAVASDTRTLLAPLAPLLVQPLSFARLRYCPLQLHDVERLFDVVERSVAHRFDGRRHRRVGGDHEHFHRQSPPLDLADELQAVHARHLQVGDDDFDVLSSPSRASASVALAHVATS